MNTFDDNDWIIVSSESIVMGHDDGPEVTLVLTDKLRAELIKALEMS